MERLRHASSVLRPTTPGGGATDQGYIQPWLTQIAMGAEHLYPPGIAIVEPRNPTSNHGAGDPATPTATFDGRRDLRRAGSIHVTPGARRLGGALRLFYGPNAGSHPHLDCFSPAFYKACGD